MRAAIFVITTVLGVALCGKGVRAESSTQFGVHGGPQFPGMVCSAGYESASFCYSRARASSRVIRYAGRQSPVQDRTSIATDFGPRYFSKCSMVLASKP